MQITKDLILHYSVHLGKANIRHRKEVMSSVKLKYANRWPLVFLRFQKPFSFAVLRDLCILSIDKVA